MKFKLTILLQILAFSFILAQNGINPIAGARGTAMADASITFQDINSIFSNQAGLAYLEQTSISLGADQRFLVSDINAFALAFAHPLKKHGTLGLSINYYGFSAYKEQKIGLSYARKLAANIALAAQFDYINFAISEYGNKSIFTFELGLQSQLTEEVIVGLHIYNPIRQEIISDEYLPTVLRLGAGYTPNKKLLITGEFEKDIEFKMQFKAGVEYYIIDILALRLGIGTQPTMNSFGLGLNLKKGIKMDIAASYHHVLGFTPAINIAYQFEKKK